MSHPGAGDTVLCWPRAGACAWTWQGSRAPWWKEATTWGGHTALWPLALGQSQPSGRASATKDTGDQLAVWGHDWDGVLATLRVTMQVLRRDLEKGKARGSPGGAEEGVRAAPQPPRSR